MFLYNTFRWPWTRIAGIVAPRPMLFANSDLDPIFPMDANDRISNRLERLYSFYGASDRVDTLVSVGGHAYRKDIRQGAFRFINAHLKGDARPVEDSEIDVVSEGNRPGEYPIAPEKLRAFPGDLPTDELNTKIDESFVPMASVPAPEAGKFDAWKKPLIDELKRVSFGYFPETIPPPDGLRGHTVDDRGISFMQSEKGIEFTLSLVGQIKNRKYKSIVIVVLNENEAGTTPDWVKEHKLAGPDDIVFYCEPRGIGETMWTTKNPPNFIARSHVLLGRTVDTGRVWDVIASVRSFTQPQTPAIIPRPVPPPPRKDLHLHVAGSGAAGLLAAYAAILCPEINEVTVVAPPHTHMDNAAPQFLNVLRVCDVPDALGLIAPRQLNVFGADAQHFARTSAAYAAADAKERLSFDSQE
jgi:hypothetical protein